MTKLAENQSKIMIEGLASQVENITSFRSCSKSYRDSGFEISAWASRRRLWNEGRKGRLEAWWLARFVGSTATFLVYLPVRR